MRKLRLVLMIILCIALLAILTGYLLPRRIQIERSLSINATQECVFNQVNNLKKWENWSPWMSKTSKLHHLYSGPEAGAGAKYTWKSLDKTVGNGSISIIYSMPSDSLLCLMDFGSNGESVGKFIFKKEQQKTIIKWILETDLGLNPITRWFGLFSDGMVGPDLMKGLINLSNLINDFKTYNGYEVIDYEMPPRILLSVRDTASTATITLKLAKMYKKISQFLKVRHLSPTGSPQAIFYDCSPSCFDVEATIPIEHLIPIYKDLYSYEVEAQNTLMVKYYGPYTDISKAYEAIQLCIKERALHSSGPPWEEYVTNPQAEPDSAKWQVNIFYPVK